MLFATTYAPSAASQTVADHVAMGVAAIEAHDLRTGLAHYEAALALDSTDYAANWRAAFALLDEGELIPDSLGGSERDSLFARAEALARRAVAADSMGPEGHFAVAATVGRAALTMGRKERIRRAKVVREEALRTLALDPTHDGAYHVLGRWNAEIMRLSGFSRFFAKKFLGAGIFEPGVVGPGDREPPEGRGARSGNGSITGWSWPASTPTASATRRRSTSWGGSRPCRTGRCSIRSTGSGPWSSSGESRDRT